MEKLQQDLSHALAEANATRQMYQEVLAMLAQCEALGLADPDGKVPSSKVFSVHASSMLPRHTLQRPPESDVSTSQAWKATHFSVDARMVCSCRSTFFRRKTATCVRL